jgi:hypothetical protein
MYTSLFHFIFMMVDLSVYAFHPPEQSRNSIPTRNTMDYLIPSQTIHVNLRSSRKKDRPFQTALAEKISHDAIELSFESRATSENNRKVLHNKSHQPNGVSNSRESSKKIPPRFGNIPDIHWRSIPMNHLRLHPHFDALPVDVHKLDCLEDVRKFRQDSWQWDALHSGRCTTSQAAGALGFLEPNAAERLKVPLSWRRGAIGAYQRLSGRPLRTLHEMKEHLLSVRWDTTNLTLQPNASSEPTESYQIWSASQSSTHYPFAAKYGIRTTPEERALRKRQSVGLTSVMSIKMMWGSAQEATSLLTALNYFHQSDPNVRLEEVGMCGAGLGDSYGILIGASPDALIRHSNGTTEVLEVKNHCPFHSVQGRRKTAKGRTNKKFAVTPFLIEEPYLQPLYVPQLMLEMLCTGCSSAIMVRQTATNGAWIIRLRRDDTWIQEMIYYLREFQNNYVTPQQPPPENMFWEQERYRAFVQHTVNLANSVELVSYVPHYKIQRTLGTTTKTKSFLSLYLDND